MFLSTLQTVSDKKIIKNCGMLVARGYAGACNGPDADAREELEKQAGAMGCNGVINIRVVSVTTAAGAGVIMTGDAIWF